MLEAASVYSNEPRQVCIKGSCLILCSFISLVLSQGWCNCQGRSNGLFFSAVALFRLPVQYKFLTLHFLQLQQETKLLWRIFLTKATLRTGMDVVCAYRMYPAEQSFSSLNSSKFAFGHDSLLPVSASFIDDRNGWGATIVDAMGTMVRTSPPKVQKINESSLDIDGLRR